MAYVLVERVASERQGCPLYFHHMTAIGPKTTPLLEEAAVYGSESEAWRSPAFCFALCCFEAEELYVQPDAPTVVRPGDAA